MCKATKSSVFPLVLFMLLGPLAWGLEDGRPVSASLSESETCVRSTPASGAGGPRGATFSAFAFTSPLTIQLLVHLGISTLTAASDLTFRIALYVLLKLAVVPGLCTVVDAQELDESVLIRLAHCHRKPLPKRKSLQPSLTRSSRLQKPLQWWETREKQVANQLWHGQMYCVGG